VQVHTDLFLCSGLLAFVYWRGYGDGVTIHPCSEYYVANICLRKELVSLHIDKLKDKEELIVLTDYLLKRDNFRVI
jgi:hypothetical protein